MIGKMLLGFGVLLCTSCAFGQVSGISLPPGEQLPVEWQSAPAIQPAPPRWSATVEHSITAPAAGIRTYWYKISHTGGGTSSPPVQAVKILVLEVAPESVLLDNGVFQFGVYQTTEPAKVKPEPVFEGDAVLTWSNFPALSGLTSGDVVYLWVRSKFMPADSTVYLQNGTFASTTVPVPGQSPIASFRTNNRALTHAAADLARENTDFTTWGRIRAVSADSFTIDDGSGVNPLIIAPGHGYSAGDTVSVGGKLKSTTPRPEISTSAFGIKKLN